MEDNPVPKGEREERILDLQMKAKEIEASKENVELELKKQAAFFRSSREELEKLYAVKMQDAMDKQRSVHEQLSKKLESIAFADEIQHQTLPWIHFIKELDSLISRQDSHSTNSSEKSNNVAKPSSRARFLTELTKTGSPVDAQLRAYRTDHALLRANVAMIQKEIIRYEKLLETQPDVGTFLTDHHCWDILKSDTSTIANTSVSTVTLPAAISRVAESSRT